MSNQQFTPDDALNLIEAALSRLEVMKVLMFSGGDSSINLRHPQMAEGLHLIFDAICDDIGSGHVLLKEAMNRANLPESIPMVQTV